MGVARAPVSVAVGVDYRLDLMQTCIHHHAN